MWSRHEFEGAVDPSVLARELATELTARLRQATNGADEATRIVNDLREAGHPIYSWDESDDFQIWGDSYAPDHGPHRMIVELRYGKDDPWSVNVEFGPWPTRDPLPSCPECKVELVRQTLLLAIQGHGSVQPEPVQFRLVLGSRMEHTGVVGNRSVHIQRAALECPQCNGVWVQPDPLPADGAG